MTGNRTRQFIGRLKTNRNESLDLKDQTIDIASQIQMSLKKQEMSRNKRMAESTLSQNQELEHDFGTIDQVLSRTENSLIRL